MVGFIVIGVILLTVCLLPNSAEWIVSQGLLVRMGLHHFFHGNVFHLAANLLPLYVMRKYVKGWQVVVGYIIASLSILATSLPVIGFSNIVYALIGLRSPSFDSWWWKHSGTIIFLVVTFAMLFIPNISAVTHIVSFTAGVVISAIVRQFKKIQNDCARYL